MRHGGVWHKWASSVQDASSRRRDGSRQVKPGWSAGSESESRRNVVADVSASRQRASLAFSAEVNAAVSSSEARSLIRAEAQQQATNAAAAPRTQLRDGTAGVVQRGDRRALLAFRMLGLHASLLLMGLGAGCRGPAGCPTLRRQAARALHGRAATVLSCVSAPEQQPNRVSHRTSTASTPCADWQKAASVRAFASALTPPSGPAASVLDRGPQGQPPAGRRAREARPTICTTACVPTGRSHRYPVFGRLGVMTGPQSWKMLQAGRVQVGAQLGLEISR
jgi:hypothetical protein